MVLKIQNIIDRSYFEIAFERRSDHKYREIAT